MATVAAERRSDPAPVSGAERRTQSTVGAATTKPATRMMRMTGSTAAADTG